MNNIALMADPWKTPMLFYIFGPYRPLCFAHRFVSCCPFLIWGILSRSSPFCIAPATVAFCLFFRMLWICPSRVFGSPLFLLAHIVLFFVLHPARRVLACSHIAWCLPWGVKFGLSRWCSLLTLFCMLIISRMSHFVCVYVLWYRLSIVVVSPPSHMLHFIENYRHEFRYPCPEDHACFSGYFIRSVRFCVF